jgi:hypothetical protein
MSSTLSHRPIRHPHLLLAPLALALLGGTCVVVEEGPDGIPYEMESSGEIIEEEPDGVPYEAESNEEVVEEGQYED